MLTNRRATAGPIAGTLLILAAVAAGCTTVTLDAKTEAAIAGITISRNAPANCRYIGEALSFVTSMEGHAIVLNPGAASRLHDEELKLHANKIGANYVQPLHEENNGLLAVVRVSAFHACNKA